MSVKLALMEGDGVGPEIVAEAVKVLKKCGERTGTDFEFVDAPAGGECYEKTGVVLPDSTLETCRKADGIIKGPVGLPDLPQGLVEKEAVLRLRQALGLYVNLRPAKLYSCLRDQSPLKDRVIGKGIDYVIVRENSEGLYSMLGETTEEKATDVNLYSRKGVSRIIEYAFEYAKKTGRKKVTSADKANILNASRFWRKHFIEIGKKYPDIQQESQYIDAMAQYIIRWPSSYDVIVTDNMFGDILSDEAAETVGSLGMGGSVNLDPAGPKMAEAIHGSAPDIAGKGIANPVGITMGCKYMLETIGLAKEAALIGKAVETALEKGARTKDIAKGENDVAISTSQMGTAIADEI